MKTKRKTLIVFLPFLIIPAILIFTGCLKKTISSQKPPIRYQLVQIPGYQQEDYEKLLKIKNEDVRYNAICNLIPYAVDYAERLSKTSDEKAASQDDPENEKLLINANEVYHQIKAQLYDPDESIKTACLIFITAFSSKYAEKNELFDLVMKVESKNIRTQYEQLHALIELVDTERIIDSKRINTFLKSRSWLIKSMTYVLLNRIHSDCFHPSLIKAYRKTEEEFDKILIVNAFENGFEGEVFDLLKDELETGRNQSVKNHCAAIIKNHRDDSAVIQWLTSHHMSIDDDTLKAILSSYYDELGGPKGTAFFNPLLSSGQQRLIKAIEQEVFFPNLYDAGLRKQQDPGALSGIVAAVHDVENLDKAWSAYKSQRRKEEMLHKEEAKKAEAFEKNVLPKYSILLESFLKDSENLFAKEGLDPNEIKEATEDIRELLQLLKKD